MADKSFEKGEYKLFAEDTTKRSWNRKSVYALIFGALALLAFTVGLVIWKWDYLTGVEDKLLDDSRNSSSVVNKDPIPENETEKGIILEATAIPVDKDLIYFTTQCFGRDGSRKACIACVSEDGEFYGLHSEHD